MRAAVVLGSLLLPTAATGQPRDIDRQLRQQRARLDSIQTQLSDLESQRNQLRSRARNINAEINNLNQQRTSTSHLIDELDRQLALLGRQVDTLTMELLLVEDALAEKQAVLQERAVAIYKRGSLWAFEVLLGAESFGDLLSRYKYLYLVSRQDQTLVGEIGTLRDRVARSRRDMLAVQGEAAAQRQARDQELQRYVRLERERHRALSVTEQRAVTTASRIDQLTRDNERLNALIASLERARADQPNRMATPTLSATDIGQLAWPVDGEVIYEYGQEAFRDGTTIPRPGIGIRATAGTTVSAVRSGEVALAGPRGTYGNLIILRHGGGYFTLYTHLSQLLVGPGDFVVEGQAIARSGGASSDEGPHVGFQLLQIPRGSDEPVPLNPLNWLQRRPR